MRRIRLAVWTACICFAGCRQQSRVISTENLTGQIVTISDAILDKGGTDTVRFGRLRSGEIAVKPLIIYNTTGRPLTIASYGRTCGCTTLEYENQPLEPNGKRSMALAFDSRGERGWQLKLLEIAFAGARRPLKLYVEAEVE